MSETPSETPKGTTSKTPTVTSKEAPTETPKAAPTETPKEAPTEISKKTPTETSEEAPIETPMVISKEASTETPMEPSKETLTETSNVAPTTAPTETSKEAPTGTPQENEAPQFTPIETTPKKRYQPVLSLTVFSHITRLHELISDWVKMRDKGTKVFRAISALKLQDCNADYYPTQMKPLMDSVVEVMDALRSAVVGVQIVNDQMVALAAMHVDHIPVISTWNVKYVARNIKFLYESLETELHLKEVIVENVAHCRDAKLIEVYTSSWELEPFFNCKSHMYLFAEVGFDPIE